MAPRRYLKVKNFERFQHYKDRNPPWIKLYNDLLDDYEFARLRDASKWLAVGLWLLASRYNNRIPADPEWIGRRINATEPVDLEPLLSAGFITMYEDASDTLAGRNQDDDLETETETEREILITGAKAPEAAPRGAEPSVVPLHRQATNQPPESGGDDAEDPKQALARYRAEAVRIILDELWQSTRDRPPGRFGRDWSLERELSIWRDLVKRYDPEEVNGAMRVMRRVGGFGDLEPLSLLLFRSREPQCRELFQRCLAFYRKQVEYEASKHAGVIRVEVVHA